MKSSTLLRLTLIACLAAAPALAQSPNPATPTPKPAPSGTAAPSVAKEPAKEPAKDTKAPLLDINTASAEELSQLKGIGDVRSAAIVKGRPYKGKDELVQKKILPEGVYAAIKDQIIAKQK